MAITVSELLAEPQLGLSLLAGSKGSANRISWAHTSDLPRLWEWVTGGELMMTNGLSIPEDAMGQVRLAEELVRAQASALAIGEQMHAPKLLPEFFAACDRLPLPIINIPFPLPFIAIARSVAESSLLEESRKLRQTARIYDLLRLAGPSDEDWQNLISGLETELDASIFVVDRRCLHPWHPSGAPLPADLPHALEPLITLEPVANKKFQWQRVQDLHVLMMDIPTHTNAILLVLPGSAPHPDAVVLLHAATLLGLELSRVALSLQNQRRLGSESLVQIFDGRLGVADIESRMSSFGLTSPEFLIVSMSGEDSEHLANIDADLWRHGSPSASLLRLNTLHLVVASPLADHLLRHTSTSDVRIGISRPTNATGLQRALQESLWALGTASSTGQQLIRYSEGSSWLGFGNFEEGNALVQKLLGPIFQYEQGEDGDLFVTLRTFLDNQRSWQKTAAALFTHRQTITYRIRKISELTGLDMTQTSTLAQLWFAVEIHKVMHLQRMQG